MKGFVLQHSVPFAPGSEQQEQFASLLKLLLVDWLRQGGREPAGESE